MQKPCLKITAFLFILISFLLVFLILYTGCELYTASPPKKDNSEKNSDDNNSSSSSTWTTQLLGVAEKYTESNGITSDVSGNVYTTGYTEGNLDGQTSTGTQDLFVVKYNGNGKKQWTKLLGVARYYTIANGITSDTNGNIYVTGYTYGVLDGQTLTGYCDLFIVKYDINGNKLWTRLLGAHERCTYANGIISDTCGNVYTTGYTTGNLDGQIKTGHNDLFVVKYDTNGNKLWTRLTGAFDKFTEARGITSDSSDNVYITGWTNGNLDEQTLIGSSGLFVVKYDQNGDKQWTKLLGASGAEIYAYGITSDISGNIYITGETAGDLDGQTKTGASDLFVVKYDTNGNKLWTRLAGVFDGHTKAYGITSDASGNVYTTGTTTGNLDGQIKTGTKDLLVVKYDTNGNKLWTRLIGVFGKYTEARGIALDLSRNVYITGWTNGNLDGQTSIGYFDLFIVKYNANGDKQ